ncbi:MAG TPA: efflux RND transporter periplasmic adaptor subunit [Opitutaceae bacterium]|nr:efflux RND transporter periplasmic adaptor subunit [Opitutaceae bacterium]
MTANTSSPTNTRWVLAAVALVIIAGVVLWAKRGAATHARKPVAAAAVPVTVTVAQTRNVDIALDALGTVTPVSTVTITSRVAGILQEVHYKEGQMVKKNDLLAVIDPRPYAAALAQARGQLARDEAQLANARLDLQRYQAAFEQHAIPEQQAASAKAAVQADEGTVQFDGAAVETARINLNYTRIVSPIDGRVGLRMVDPGNNIPANGTNGLVTVTQMKPITVVFTLAQEHLPEVLAGMRGGAPLRVQAFERTSQKPVADGKLLTIDNQIDAATGTFRLKAIFANANTSLWPGEFVNLRFVVGVRKDVVTVPPRAVQSGPDGSYVFVINPNQTVTLRNVEAITTDQNVTVIDRGIQPGEHVVLDGQYRLENGTKVVVQHAGAMAASGAKPTDS